MDQNKIEATKPEITFVDILKMFRGKLKLLICVTLIFAVLGAGAGVFASYLTTPYGAEITFYLLPGESSQALLPILKSDAFAEKLLLDENGLPPRAECDPTQYDEALKAVEAENAARAERLRLYREVSAYPYSLAIIQGEYDKLNSERVRINDLLKMYKSAQDAIASQPDHLEKIAEYEQELAQAEAAWKKYKTEVYDPAIAKSVALEEEYFLARRALTDVRKAADIAVERVVSVWREKKEVQELVATIQKSVTYEYIKIIDDDKAEETVENQNTSFLVISVAVPRDEETAQEIVDMIKARTPLFVEKEVERLTGAAEAQCTLTSTFVEATEKSELSLIKGVVFGGAIGAILSFALVCAFIIAKNFIPTDLFPKKEKKSTKK